MASSSPPVAPLDLGKAAVQFPAWCETRGYGCKRLLSRSHFSTVWLVQAKNAELRVLKEMHVAAASDAERLPREAELLLAQRHPFILREEQLGLARQPLRVARGGDVHLLQHAQFAILGLDEPPVSYTHLTLPTTPYV